MSSDIQDARIYTVVVNAEEQYSIWLADQELPEGWRHAGKEGSRDQCLAYISNAWKDMRPLSVREREGIADDPIA